jgi:hypothetical protein
MRPSTAWASTAGTLHKERLHSFKIDQLKLEDDF